MQKNAVYGGQETKKQKRKMSTFNENYNKLADNIDLAKKSKKKTINNKQHLFFKIYLYSAFLNTHPFQAA